MAWLLWASPLSRNCIHPVVRWHPYGASHVSQMNSKLSEDESELARQLGKRLAKLARQLKDASK